MADNMVIRDLDDEDVNQKAVDLSKSVSDDDLSLSQGFKIQEVEDIAEDYYYENFENKFAKEVLGDLIMKVDTNITLDSVILSPENKAKITDFINENENREKLLRDNLEPMNRLLFYGASGCGKTYLAKALSNHLGYKMLYVDIARALSQGNVAINLSNVFKLSHMGDNYMIFLDECDSIAWNRDSDNAEGGDIRRATNSLFQQMDQMRPDTIIICATNMLKRLDPAFERRFNLKLAFERPNTDIQTTIRRFLKPGFSLIADKYDAITERRTKLSYYELQGVAERCMKRAVLNNSLTVRMTDVYLDIAKAMNFKISFGSDNDAE